MRFGNKNLITEIPVCPYCNEQSQLVTGEEVYPHRSDLNHKWFYICKPCKAWVGCHPSTKVPLGTLANRDLRQMRSRVHSVFDPLWKGKTSNYRYGCYRWLADKMDIIHTQCHIGMFTMKQCKQALQILNDKHTLREVKKVAKKYCNRKY